MKSRGGLFIPLNTRVYYIIKHGYSSTYQNQMVNAIKLFYQKM